MARRKRQAPPQVEVEPPAPSRTSNPDRPTRRSRRAQTRAPVVDHGEGESFDIDDVSGGSDDDGEDDYDEDKDDDIPDIHCFFKKDDKKMVCVVCRETSPPPKVKYEFSANTSNTSLRPHIESQHFELYVQLAKMKGWKIRLPGLLSQLRSRGTGAGVTSEGERPTFERAFHDGLLKLILANNQRLSLVESPQFRDILLYLKSDLTDSEIPDQTKLQELLIQAWKETSGSTNDM